MKSSAEISPFKLAVEEVDLLRHVFRSTLEAYSARVESKLSRAREALESGATEKKSTSTRIRDARDIITLVRTLEIKPEKGRRRELKKVEGVVDDLLQIIDGWGSKSRSNNSEEPHP